MGKLGKCSAIRLALGRCDKLRSNGVTAVLYAFVVVVVVVVVVVAFFGSRECC